MDHARSFLEPASSMVPARKAQYRVAASTLARLTECEPAEDGAHSGYYYYVAKSISKTRVATV